MDQKFALADHIRKAVLTLQFQPGADLDEQALGLDFELSRTPVREVLRMLDGQGYVDLRKNRGARVSELSATTLRDFFLAAPMIYGAILRLAARNGTKSQLETLQSAQSTFRATLRSGNVADRALANVRFHEITGEMADNIYLLPSFNRLLIDHARIGMTFYRPQSTDMIENLDKASQQHDAIIDAISHGDEEKAAALADEHWALSRGQIELFVMPGGLDAPLGATPREA